MKILSKSGTYRWVGKARKDVDPEKRGGLTLIKEHVFDVVNVKEVVVRGEPIVRTICFSERCM